MTGSPDESSRDADLPLSGGRRAGRGAWYLALAVMVLAGLLRFHELGDEGGLWLDEIWSLMNAAGKGAALDALPAGAVQEPGTDWTEMGVVPWTRIWSNTVHDVHPPGLYLWLRGWTGMFGASEFAARSLPVTFSLAAMPVMFLLGRETIGAWRSALALGLYATCCGAIFFAQECRGYTMVQFWLVCLAWFSWRVVARGATVGRLAGMGAAIYAGMMTHYFFVGAGGGLALWAVACARRGERARVAGAAGGAGALFALTWGPWMWEQRNFWAIHQHLLDLHWTVAREIDRVLAAPARMLLPSSPADGVVPRAFGVLVLLVIPGLAMVWCPQRRRGVGLWWAYLAGGIAFVGAVDVGRRGLGLEVPRYTSFLMPALCALMAGLGPPARWRWGGARWVLAAPALVVIALSCGWTWRSAYVQKAWWRDAARAFAPRMGPGDAIVFQSDLPNDWRPKYQYMCFAQYEGAARRLPHILVIGPEGPSGAAAQAIGAAGRVWVFSMRAPEYSGPNLGALEETSVWPLNVRSAETPLSVRLMTPRGGGGSSGGKAGQP